MHEYELATPISFHTSNSLVEEEVLAELVLGAYAKHAQQCSHTGSFEPSAPCNAAQHAMSYYSPPS